MPKSDAKRDRKVELVRTLGHTLRDVSGFNRKTRHVDRKKRADRLACRGRNSDAEA